MNQEIKKRISEINNGIVPNGYEKTDFGIFPIDWEYKRLLGDLGIFDKGQGLPGDKMSDQDDVPCMGYGDIYTKYNYHFEYAKNFTDKRTAIGGTKIGKGTLCFTGTGETAEEIGKCVCYNGNEPIYAGGDIILFNSYDVNPLFLAYQQYCNFSVKKKASFGQGHSVVHIHKENLEKMHIAYPKDTHEQEKIADILMKWDNAIDLQEQYIQKLEERRDYNLNKYFTHTKENCRFMDLYIKAGEGGTPSTEKSNYYENGDIPFVKIEHLYSKYLDSIDSYITKLGMEKSGAWLVPENSLIFSNGATIGEATINRIKVTTKQGILGIIPNEKIDVEYFYYLVKSKYFLNKIKAITTKGTMVTAYLKDIDKIKLYIPDIAQQKNIAKFLSLLDEEISLQKEKLDKLKLQRKAMQEYLLTGVVRVG